MLILLGKKISFLVLMKRIIKWIGFLMLGFLFLMFTVFGISYYYKSDILNAVNAELKKNINGDIGIGDIDFSLLEDFPSFSITLKDVYVRGSNYERYHSDFLNAKKLSLDVQIVSFLQKRIVIRSIKLVDGNVFVFRTKNGYSNLDIFRKNKPDTITSKNPTTVTLKKIWLDNVHAYYQDSLKGKSFGVDFFNVKTNIIQTDSSIQCTLAGSLKFNELTLNAHNGSFLKGKPAHVKLNFEFIPGTQTLAVHSSVLKFKHSDVTLTGAFYFKNPGRFNLKIQSNALDYNEGSSLLTEIIQSRLEKFNIEKPVTVAATIQGSLEPGLLPLVDIQFQFSDSRVSVPKVKIERTSMAGSFSNHMDSTGERNDKNSILTVRSFNGIIEDVPTRLTATFKDLRDPYINLHSTVSLDLSSINEKVDTTRMKFLDGKFNSKVNYEGKLSEYLNPDKTSFTGKLSGSVSLKNGAFDYKPRKQHLKNVQASFRFTKDSLIINSLSFDLNKNPVKINGQILGFVPFFHQPEKKGSIKLLITSPAFDLTALLSKNSHKKLSGKQRAEKKKSISEMLDKLYSKVEFDLTVKVDALSYQNFNGADVRGRLLLNNNSLKAVNMKMKLAGGAVDFTLNLNDLQKEIKKLSVTGSVDHADISQFFYAFNNFNQTTVNHKNLEGSVNMDVKFTTRINDDYAVLTPTMEGNINLSIKDGKLNNFEPLQKMNNFLFKNRDFDVVQFGELNTFLSLTGPELDIERMEIESSVLRLFLEGRYSFADSTDLSIQLPLSNLKKRDKNYQPKNIGVDTKAGPSIFLHVFKDSDGKTVFAYDPFKRHAKK